MWNKPSLRHLFLALLLSLLAHVALFGQLPAWLMPEEDAVFPIQVELVQLPPPAAPQPAPAAPAPRKTAPASKPERVPVAAKPSPDAPPPIQPPPTAEPIPPVAPAPATETPPPVAAAPDPADDPPPPLPEDDPPAVPPRHVEIDYQIWRKGSVAGIERHRYQVEADGRYTLQSTAEPKGLLALALSDLVQKSEGIVTERGLRPTSFLYQYGNNADKAQKASFDWQTSRLTMKTGARLQTVDLPEGAQDLMSFMYQFMFTPPLQEMQLTITNGKRLKTYAYGFDGEESVETQMGPIRCLHIGRSSDDGEEKTELWLATDYHYLPVKISKTEKDGTVLERIATRLQTEQ
jgi:hypothetical protein